MNPSLLEAQAVALTADKLDQLLQKLFDLSISAGRHIITAILVYMVGAFLVKVINRMVHGMLNRRHIAVSV